MLQKNHKSEKLNDSVPTLSLSLTHTFSLPSPLSVFFYTLFSFIQVLFGILLTVLKSLNLPSM